MSTKFSAACQLLSIIILLASRLSHAGLLYPRPSETRETVSLDGIWNFVASPLTDPLIGFRDFWYKRHLTTVSCKLSLVILSNELTRKSSEITFNGSELSLEITKIRWAGFQTKTTEVISCTLYYKIKHLFCLSIQTNKQYTTSAKHSIRLIIKWYH